MLARNTKKQPALIARIILLVAAIGMVAMMGYTYSLGVVPFKYLATFAFVALVFWGILWLLLVKLQSTLWRSVGYVLFCLGLVLSLGYVYVAQQGFDALSKFTGSTQKEVRYDLVVLKDAQHKLVDDLKDKSVGYVSQLDKKYIDQIQEKVTLNSLKSSPGYVELVDELYSDSYEAIIINSAFRSVITERKKAFDKETRVVKSFTFYEKNAEAKKNLIATDKSFNLYISGIDTYGSVATVSRSDVNIVASMNFKTHKIMLTTVPRDSYVAIPGGGAGQKDKLTHAGIYGVDASMGAVGGLLDIEFAGYVRINFTSLIRLVDALGGITVSNPTGFTSEVNNEFFPVGNVYMDGESALAYSRERHSLAAGDNDRGKNQMRVITAIIQKLSSFSSVAGYQQVLDVLGESVQTNVSDKDIRAIMSHQIDTGKGWDVQSYALTGTGSTGVYPSYAMPSARLYMYSLDDASVTTAKNQIQQILQP